MRTRDWLYVGFALILILVIIGLNQAHPIFAEPDLSLVSTIGKSGEKIDFVTSGFNAGGQVTIYWDHERQPVGYDIPLRGGGFFIVPEYVKPGIHVIRADGTCGGLEVVWGCSAYANFTVVGSEPDLSYKAITLSPLKQFKLGIVAQDVQCKTNFVLIMKSNDNSPICVRPDTSHILIQRGWAKEFVQTTGTESVEMMVIRITNNTGALNVNYTAVRTVSPEVLTKYPLLQSALQDADKQLEKFNKFVKSTCSNTMPCPITAAYSTKIPAVTAKTLIDDPDLHFRVYESPPSSIKLSYINISGVTYIIYLNSPQ
jgi:hypothetical protein